MIHQSFIPGASKNIKKLSKADLQSRIECLCFQDEYSKFKTAENDPSYQSNTLRLSNIILNNNGVKKNLRKGNTYLNLESQLLIDSLGSIEGQPGGSFRPLRNKF